MVACLLWDIDNYAIMISYLMDLWLDFSRDHQLDWLMQCSQHVAMQHRLIPCWVLKLNQSFVLQQGKAIQAFRFLALLERVVLEIIKIVGHPQCFSWGNLHGVPHALRVPAHQLTEVML